MSKTKGGKNFIQTKFGYFEIQQKSEKKLCMLKMSRTLILPNNNAAKLSTNRQKSQ